MKYTVTAVLSISHTDEIEADNIFKAQAIVDEWIADDFTEDEDCSRSWVTEIVELVEDTK
jgi:hypothetical protein